MKKAITGLLTVVLVGVLAAVVVAAVDTSGSSSRDGHHDRRGHDR